MADEVDELATDRPPSTAGSQAAGGAVIRPQPDHRPDRAGGEPRAARRRPDPRPMRFAIGMTGLAAVTAIATAVIRSPAPAQVVLPATADTATPPPAAPPALIHLR